MGIEGRFGTGNMAGNGIHRVGFPAVTFLVAHIKKLEGRLRHVRQDRPFVYLHLFLGIGQETAAGAIFHAADGGAVFGLPGAQVTVEDRDIEMTKPAQHPPEAATVDPAVVVIGDHLHALVDAPLGKGLGEIGDARQRMAPRLPRNDRAGKVLIQMGVNSAGDVCRGIELLPGRRIIQFKATVDQRPIWVTNMGGKLRRRDEGCIGHRGSFQFGSLIHQECKIALY